MQSDLTPSSLRYALHQSHATRRGYGMTTKHLQMPSPLVTVAQTVFTVAQIVLLIVIWSVFFLWAVVVTEHLFVPWITTVGREQQSFVDFISSWVGASLLALILVMISLTLFFYRMPRARNKMSVPFEFGLTTLLFVVVHLIAVGLGSFLFPAWLPLELWAPLERLLSTAPGVASHFYQAPALAITALMLAGLFWLQGSERMWRYIRRGWQRIVALPRRA